MKRIFTTLAVIGIAIVSCKKKDHAAPPPIAPTVTTTAVTNITINSATTGGNITSDGGAAVTKSGVVWSKTNTTPTFKDSVVAGNVATGPFTSNITGLDFNNTYYVRAFAINSVDTAYGSVLSFSTANDTSKVRFTYNGQEVVYGIIISPTTGKKWLDRNLGAKQVAIAYNDYLAFGDLFQWGRPADGHQLMNWTSSTAVSAVNGITTILATSDIPGHNNFIDATSSPNYDWRSDNNQNRWTTAHQGPCPAGWHVPSEAEWLAEVSNTVMNGVHSGTATSGGIIDRNTAYGLLKITVNARREGFGGTFAGIGRGYYWSTTGETTANGSSAANAFNITSTGGIAIAFQSNKSQGCAVRCVKD